MWYVRTKTYLLCWLITGAVLFTGQTLGVQPTVSISIDCGDCDEAVPATFVHGASNVTLDATYALTEGEWGECRLDTAGLPQNDLDKLTTSVKNGEPVPILDLGGFKIIGPTAVTDTGPIPTVNGSCPGDDNSPMVNFLFSKLPGGALNLSSAITHGQAKIQANGQIVVQRQYKINGTQAYGFTTNQYRTLGTGCTGGTGAVALNGGGGFTGTAFATSNREGYYLMDDGRGTYFFPQSEALSNFDFFATDVNLLGMVFDANDAANTSPTKIEYKHSDQNKFYVYPLSNFREGTVDNDHYFVLRPTTLANQTQLAGMFHVAVDRYGSGAASGQGVCAAYENSRGDTNFTCLCQVGSLSSTVPFTVTMTKPGLKSPVKPVGLTVAATANSGQYLLTWTGTQREGAGSVMYVPQLMVGPNFWTDMSSYSAGPVDNSILFSGSQGQIIRLKAFNNMGGKFSNTVYVPAWNGGSVARPGELKLVSQTGNEAVISFKNTAGQTTSNVEMLGPDGSWFTYSTYNLGSECFGPDANTYSTTACQVTLVGLAAGYSTFVRVVNFNPSGVKAYSQGIRIDVEGKVVPTPSGFMVNNDAQPRVAIMDFTPGSGIDGSEWRWSTNGWVWLDGYSGGPSTTQFTAAGLPPSGSAYFQVRSFKDTGSVRRYSAWTSYIGISIVYGCVDNGDSSHSSVVNCQLVDYGRGPEIRVNIAGGCITHTTGTIKDSANNTLADWDISTLPRGAVEISPGHEHVAAQSGETYTCRATQTYNIFGVGSEIARSTNGPDEEYSNPDSSWLPSSDDGSSGGSWNHSPGTNQTSDAYFAQWAPGKSDQFVCYVEPSGGVGFVADEIDRTQKALITVRNMTNGGTSYTTFDGGNDGFVGLNAGVAAFGSPSDNYACDVTFIGENGEITDHFCQISTGQACAGNIGDANAVTAPEESRDASCSVVDGIPQVNVDCENGNGGYLVSAELYQGGQVVASIGSADAQTTTSFSFGVPMEAGSSMSCNAIVQCGAEVSSSYTNFGDPANDANEITPDGGTNSASCSVDIDYGSGSYDAQTGEWTFSATYNTNNTGACSGPTSNGGSFEVNVDAYGNAIASCDCGSSGDGDIAGVYGAPPPSSEDPSLAHSCEEGTVWDDEAGSCVADSGGGDDGPPPECDPGLVWNVQSGSCEDPSGVSGACEDPETCEEGTSWDSDQCACVGEEICEDDGSCQAGESWDTNTCGCVPDGSDGSDGSCSDGGCCENPGNCGGQASWNGTSCRCEPICAPTEVYYSGINSCGCPDGEFWTGSGCFSECPQDTYYNGEECAPAGSCPGGQVCVDNCNSCACPEGTTWDGDSCENDCQNGQSWQVAQGACGCPEGTTDTGSSCDPICQSCENWLGVEQGCESQCSGGQSCGSEGCSCGEGNYFDGNSCVPGSSCDSNACETSDGSGGCVSTCSGGDTCDGNGACVAPCEDPGTCEEGTSWDSGSCSCV